MTVSRAYAAAAAIEERKDVLAARISARTIGRHPEMVVRYGLIGQQRCLEDAHYHLRFLMQALRSGRASIFAEYVCWAAIMLAERKVPEADLHANLDETIAVLREELAVDQADVATAYVAAAKSGLDSAPPLTSFLPPDAPYAELASAYLQALLRGDRAAAGALVEQAVASGVPVRDIYLHVFQQSQREVGRLWQTNRIGVAHEHFCTAATQVIMTRLYPQIFRTPRVGRTFVGTCVGGELHEMGMRMVCDFFEMEGWDAHYLGASLPTAHFIKYLEGTKVDVIGISATMTYHVREVADIIAAIRERSFGRAARVMVGGYPFLKETDLWKEIGADGFATDAAASVVQANELVG